MSVRLKITLLFLGLVFCILGLVCTSIYIFSSASRGRYIESRLKNVAITTGNFLSRDEIFSYDIIRKIDSLTAKAFTRKIVLAYNQFNKKIYSFYDNDDDTLILNSAVLSKARSKEKIYTRIDKRDVVFYHYMKGNDDFIIVVGGYDEFGHQNLKNLSIILLLSFIPGILIAVLVGYIFSKILLKPLERIADQANEISAANLIKRLDTGSVRDEWNYLTETLNNLLNRLEESFKLQGQFISNASHELFTPLTSISSQLEISLQRERTPEEYRKIMYSVYDDIQHISKLTGTLLEIAKASGSKSGIEIKRVRIDEVILLIISKISKEDKDYKVLVDFSKLPANEESLVVLGNEELLLAAISNIVVNGCKYSSNQQATISLYSNAKNIIISIQNTGTGIPQNELENIFQPFYRIDENYTNIGFGLGLSLAKKIIQLHDGKITVISKKDEETVFLIYLVPAT